MIKFPVVQVQSPEQLSELCRHGVLRSSVGKKTKQNKKTALLLGGCARGSASTEQKPKPNVGCVKFFRPSCGQSGRGEAIMSPHCLPYTAWITTPDESGNLSETELCGSNIESSTG